jgi:hypothetical protein
VKLILPVFIILGVTGVTFAIVWVRYDQLAAAPDNGTGQVPDRRLFSFAFTMAAFLFGIMVTLGFYFATGWWQSAERVLFRTAIGLTVLLSVGAAIVRTQVVRGGVAESIALNLLWGLGYGWILPTIMRVMGLVR